MKTTTLAVLLATAADCREFDTYWYTCANDATHSAKDDAAAADNSITASRALMFTAVSGSIAGRPVTPTSASITMPMMQCSPIRPIMRAERPTITL